MVKTRVNKKKRSNRTRRMQGGHLTSCLQRKNDSMNPLWKKYGNFVTVTEDEMKIAKPSEKFCFGDAFTTCMVIALVMENGYKVAAHINPMNHIISNNTNSTTKTPKQTYNPQTVLPFFQKLLQINPNFKNSTIKYIYVITSLDDIKIDKPTGQTYTTNIYNAQYAEIRKSGMYKRLNASNKKTFFEFIFPGKVTATTIIDVQKNKEVQHGTDGLQHFYINEDGSLDLVAS